MTVKSIIDVEVNYAAFAKFAALFNEYQALLNKTPGVWKKVTEAVDEAKDSTDAVSDTMEETAGSAKSIQNTFHQNIVLLHQHNEAINQQAEVQKRVKDETVQQSRAWRDMSRNAKSFASHIADGTRSLLRWASLTGIISGVLGAGGLFGIERLAASAGGQRRSALGLGVTPGQLQSFSLNYGRVVDPGSILGGVNEALHDPTKAAPLFGLGLNYQSEQQKGTAAASVDVLNAIKRLADRTPEALAGTVFQSRQLAGLGLSLEDFLRLKHTPAAELNRYNQQYGADARGLNLTEGQQRAWQDLQVQLSRATRTIENTFIVALTDLAKPIGDVSKGFAHLVESLGRSPEVKALMDDAADGLEAFAKYLGTPQFKSDVQSFASGVKAVAADIRWALEKIGILPTEGGNATDAPTPPWKIKPGEPGSKENPIKPDGPLWHLFKNDAPGSSGGNPSDWNNVIPGAYHPGSDGARFIPATFRTGGNSFSSIEAKNGLPSGLLSSVSYAESRNNPNAVSPAGAMGQFQFTSDTARQYGLSNPFDPGAAASAAGRYLRDLLSRFNGNLEEAVAAYNAGPGTVQRDLAKYGADWRAHLPQETQRYIGSVLGGIGGMQQAHQFKDRSVTVKIENRTGGNATVSVSQLAV
jgi:hypothetical protein